jgi:hypothetical protein
MTEFKYTTHSRIAAVEERFTQVHLTGAGAKAEFTQISTGWWFMTEGPSPVTVRCGVDKNY